MLSDFPVFRKLNHAVQAKCPVCGTLLTCRTNASDRFTGDRLEIPAHGKTIEMDCRGGDKWYSFKKASDEHN